MEDFLARIVENLIGRVSGPMKFRLILQPLMAAVFAVRDGLKDAREERPPYFRAIFTHPDRRSRMLRDGCKSVGKIFVIAVVIDLVEHSAGQKAQRIRRQKTVRTAYTNMSLGGT